MLLQFMRRTAGGDEVDFIKIESTVRGSCHRQMPGMDGIKRAAK
jgi:hypothetical protein